MEKYPRLDQKKFEDLFRISDRLRQLKLDAGKLTLGEYKLIQTLTG